MQDIAHKMHTIPGMKRTPINLEVASKDDDDIGNNCECWILKLRYTGVHRSGLNLLMFLESLK